jgi:hypothetical protein
MPQFKTQRADGRPDWRVVYDMICEAPPDSVFTYDDLESAIAEDIETPVTRGRVCRAVLRANTQLQTVHDRSVENVIGQGYRIIHAREHVRVSGKHNLRAFRQHQHEVRMLKHVRSDELTATERDLLEGTLKISSGVFQSVRMAIRERDRRERAIKKAMNGG